MLVMQYDICYNSFAMIETEYVTDDRKRSGVEETV